MKIRIRVAAYILRQTAFGCSQLLLFRHPDCFEAPVQVPAGGVNGDESLEAALDREIWEESGLTQLQLVRKLGVAEWNWPLPQTVASQTHCFLLQAPASTADTWNHRVQGNGLDAGLELAYFWMRPGLDFRLHGSLGDFLTPAAIPELYDSPLDHYFNS